MTYGLDGEGRPNALKNASVTVVPTSGVTYNAASEPTLIDIYNTSTDSDAYQYDSSGRMTNATFTLNSGTAKTWAEALAWNPNNTLEAVGIVDGFNSGGTQYCAFNSSYVTGTGYDDLGRLIGVGCGTSSAYTGTNVMSQTFSLDQYDNLTQAGSFAFNPGYNSSTSNNHEDSPAVYDASGNQTTDVSGNKYTYDQFNKLLSVNLSGTGCASSGECIVYDAFGKIVEVDIGSTTREYFYPQGGAKVIFNGATINSAFWPSPGGGTFYDTGNNSSYDYMHKDWRGNTPFVSAVVAHAYKADMAYAPYGEIYNLFGTGDSTTEMFNFSLQGITSGLFDTPNRELSSTQGRWLNPDPAGAGWNQYAYGTNPNSQIDPSGLLRTPIFGGGGGGGCAPDDPFCGGGCDPYFGCGGGCDPDFGCPGPILPPGGGGGGGSGSGGSGGVGGPGTGGGSNILPGEDSPSWVSWWTEIANLLGGFPCQTDFGAPCSGNFTNVPGYQPPTLAQLLSLQIQQGSINLFWDTPGPPTLCRSYQCGAATISGPELPTVSAVQPPTPPPAISGWDALQTCAQFLPLMAQPSSDFPSSLDQYPEGQMGTTNSARYQEYNPVSQGQGAAAAGAAGQVGTVLGCTGGALSQ